MFALQPNEKIVLDNGNLGFRKKLILTNKRLITMSGKGVFNVTWSKENELSLTDIETVTLENYALTSGSFLKISKKNGEKVDLEFKLKDEQVLGASIQLDTIAGLSTRQNNECVKWLAAINQQIK